MNAARMEERETRCRCPESRLPATDWIRRVTARRWSAATGSAFEKKVYAGDIGGVASLAGEMRATIG